MHVYLHTYICVSTSCIACSARPSPFGSTPLLLRSLHLDETSSSQGFGYLLGAESGKVKGMMHVTKLFIPLQSLNLGVSCDIGSASELARVAAVSKLDIIGLLIRCPRPLSHFFSGAHAHVLQQLQANCGNAVCWLYNDYGGNGTHAADPDHLVIQLTEAGRNVIGACSANGAHDRCSIPLHTKFEELVQRVQIRILTSRCRNLPADFTVFNEITGDTKQNFKQALGKFLGQEAETDDPACSANVWRQTWYLRETPASGFMALQDMCGNHLEDVGPRVRAAEDADNSGNESEVSLSMYV